MANADLGAWVTKAVGFLLMGTTVLLMIGVGQELLSGITMSTNKWGPRTVYTQATEPFKY